MKISRLLRAFVARFPLSPPSPPRGEGDKASLREES